MFEMTANYEIMNYSQSLDWKTIIGTKQCQNVPSQQLWEECECCSWHKEHWRPLNLIDVAPRRQELNKTPAHLRSSAPPLPSLWFNSQRVCEMTSPNCPLLTHCKNPSLWSYDRNLPRCALGLDRQFPPGKLIGIDWNLLECELFCCLINSIFKQWQDLNPNFCNWRDSKNGKLCGNKQCDRRGLAGRLPTPLLHPPPPWTTDD